MLPLATAGVLARSACMLATDSGRRRGCLPASHTRSSAFEELGLVDAIVLAMLILCLWLHYESATLGVRGVPCTSTRPWQRS